MNSFLRVIYFWTSNINVTLKTRLIYWNIMYVSSFRKLVAEAFLEKTYAIPQYMVEVEFQKTHWLFPLPSYFSLQTPMEHTWEPLRLYWYQWELILILKLPQCPQPPSLFLYFYERKYTSVPIDVRSMKAIQDTVVKITGEVGGRLRILVDVSCKMW